MFWTNLLQYPTDLSWDVPAGHPYPCVASSLDFALVSFLIDKLKQLLTAAGAGDRRVRQRMAFLPPLWAAE